MSFVLWRADETLGIASDRQVLRADELPLFTQLPALLAHLRTLIDEQQARCDAALAQARDEGLRAGREAARAEAAAQLAAQTAALAREAGQARERDRAEVGRLALEVARLLVGELPAPERLLALAEQAARELRPATVLRLQVAPALAGPLRTALAARGERHLLAEVEVVADAALGEDDCRLVTSRGRADASLAQRLQRLADLTEGVT